APVVSHAAADLAAPKLARPPLLRVLHQRAPPQHQARTTARAVRPQRAVASADGAVALREPARPARDLEHDGTAVTGRVQHRVSLRHETPSGVPHRPRRRKAARRRASTAWAAMVRATMTNRGLPFPNHSTGDIITRESRIVDLSSGPGEILSAS